MARTSERKPHCIFSSLFVIRKKSKYYRSDLWNDLLNGAGFLKNAVSRATELQSGACSIAIGKQCETDIAYGIVKNNSVQTFFKEKSKNCGQRRILVASWKFCFLTLLVSLYRA